MGSVAGGKLSMVDIFLGFLGFKGLGFSFVMN